MFGNGSMCMPVVPPVATVYQFTVAEVVVSVTFNGTTGPMCWQYCVVPETGGAGGVVVTFTVMDERGLSQLPMIWLAQNL